MSDVIAIRVSKKLKEELRELDFDYVEEVRECLERMVKKKKLKQVMREVDKFRNELTKRTGATIPSADTIRQDREHGH